MYILVDEYDYAINSFIEHGGYRDVVWQKTPLGMAMKNFWSVIKRQHEDSIVGRAFITGVTPFALDSTTSGFDLAQNISHNPDFSSLCGLTKTDIKTLTKRMGVDSDAHLNVLTKYTNGYHFCRDTQVQPVYNTAMCFAALQVLLLCEVQAGVLIMCTGTCQRSSQCLRRCCQMLRKLRDFP